MSSTLSREDFNTRGGVMRVNCAKSNQTRH